jgi:hypothetical protein
LKNLFPEAVEDINAKVLASSSGRDKIMKLFQYGARVAMWYYSGKQAEKAAAFGSLMGSARRVGYLFGSLQSLPGMVNDFATFKPEVRSILKTTADVCDFTYCICDNVPLFADYGMLPMKNKTKALLYENLGSKTWFVSSICWTMLDILELQRVMQVQKTKKDKASALELKLVLAGLINDLGNLLIALFFLYPNNGVINSPIAGGLGVLGAVMGLWARMQSA